MVSIFLPGANLAHPETDDDTDFLARLGSVANITKPAAFLPDHSSDFSLERPALTDEANTIDIRIIPDRGLIVTAQSPKISKNSYISSIELKTLYLSFAMLEISATKNKICVVWPILFSKINWNDMTTRANNDK